MHAGTLGVLSEPADDPLESWARNDGRPPALDVRQTQDTFDGHPVQTGRAAARVEVSQRDVLIDGASVTTSSVDTVETAYAEWLAEVTRSGVVLASSVAADDGSVSIVYGERAKLADVDSATIGIGFERTFEGSDTRGVVFEGGYVACYRDWPPEKALGFVERELLPYAFEYEPEQDEFDPEEIWG